MVNIKIKKISENFLEGGAVITPKLKNFKINNLKKSTVNKLFHQKGILIFDNFKSTYSEFYQFTKKFTKSYANDAIRRKEKFKNKVLRSVDLGNKKVPLHSESSFTVTRPQIIWFMCINPPKKNTGGETIICDGSTLWESLDAQTKTFFKKEPIKYFVNIKLRNKISKGKKKWFLNFPGISNEIIDFKKKIVSFNYKTFAVEKNYLNSKLYFCNHLLSVNDESQIEKALYKNKKIPKIFMQDIYKKVKKITYAHNWKKNQIIMIDNHKFMHGRNKIIKSSKRDIINVQTLVANLL
jgi:alpha-ketoglutarate-dependent taurine dioxygenase